MKEFKISVENDFNDLNSNDSLYNQASAVSPFRLVIGGLTI